MSRLFPELLDAMSAAAGKDEEARALIRRFHEAALPDRWTEKVLPDDRHPFVFTNPYLEERHVPVFFVDEDVLGDRDDPIVWRHPCFNDVEDGAEHLAMFVDAVPCHRDWLGLKAISEYALIEQREHIVDLVVDATSDLHPSIIERAVLREACNHLVDRRWAMIYRLVDAKLHGRVRALHQRKRKVRMTERQMTEALERGVTGLYHHAWPSERNKDEHEVRREIAKWTAGGVIASARFKLPTH